MTNPFLAIDRQILADSGTSGTIRKNLLRLCDDIGPRFAGSEGYRRAADFMLERFADFGLDNARLEAFDFTAWRRGEPACLTMQSPILRTIECYALPYGAANAPRGDEAEIVDIGAGGSDEIAAKEQQIKGRFVLTTCVGNHRIEVYARCVELGAAGFILSGTAEGMILPTGCVTNAEKGAIPALGIALESALQIKRFIKEECCPRCRILTHGSFEPATTWNVLGELPGTEFADELVILGGHLDSHDIGPGAFDNAAGAVLVMETARLLAKQRVHLRRTIRFIGFGAEEVGLLGSHYHAERHAAELLKARLMVNCDTPSLGRPRGLAFHQCPKAAPYMARLAEQMAEELVCQNRSGRHSDHYPFILQGLPTAGVGGGHFAPSVRHFVHMAADSPDKISFSDLRGAASFIARFLVRAANDEQWPDMRRTPDEINAWKTV